MARGVLALVQILNIVFAWVSAALIFLLSILYPLRKYGQSRRLPAGRFFLKLNRSLRKIHKPMGVLLIGTGFLHCFFSDQKLGLNTGTACLFLTVMAFISFLLRGFLKKRWLPLHRLWTLALWVLLIGHVILTRIFKGGLL